MGRSHVILISNETDGQTDIPPQTQKEGQNKEIQKAVVVIVVFNIRV